MSYTVAEVKHGTFASSYECSTHLHEENRPAAHPGLEIFYELNSPLHMKLRGKRTIVRPSEFLIYNAREDHSELHERTSIHLRTLVIEEEFVNELLKDLNLDFRDLVFDQTRWNISPFAVSQLNLIAQMRNSECFAPDLEELVFSQLTLDILMTQPHSHSEKLRRAVGTGRFPRAKSRAQKIILSQLRENRLSLQVLAEEVGMSKFHFLRSFKREIEMTPIQYLNRIKIEMAKVELLASDAKVTDVAFGLGFENLSTFYALFKREAAGEPRRLKQSATGSRIESQTYRYLTVPA